MRENILHIFRPQTILQTPDSFSMHIPYFQQFLNCSTPGDICYTYMLVVSFADTHTANILKLQLYIHCVSIIIVVFKTTKYTIYIFDLLPSVLLVTQLFLYTLFLLFFLLLKLGESTIVTLAVLSLQRLMTATNPEKYKLTSYRKSFLVITGIWCYILCISLPPFIGFGAFVVESSGVT